MRQVAELVLDAVPDAVPRARHYVAEALAGRDPDLIDRVELVTSELVTNALLHGNPPIVLAVPESGDRVRIEVTDRGHGRPLLGLRNPDAMTGRGIALVATVADRWGVEPRPDGGKTVWAELAEKPAELGADGDLLHLWDVGGLELPRPALPDEPRFDVRLGSVPTDLLIAAKSHIDNVVRELTLAGSDQTAAEELPEPMARLVHIVTTEWSEARDAIKRQAVASAERGEQITELELRLPASAADAGERYLEAMEEADQYARAARLLTLAPPPSHQVFRRWYVHAIVDQLRAASTGVTPPIVPPFPQALADEIERLSSLEDAWHRLQLLQKVTAELTGGGTVEELVATVVDNAMQFLGASSTRIYLVEDDVLRSVGAAGTPDATVQLYDAIPLTADLPGPLVARTGRPMFLRNRAQMAEEFPVLAGVYDTERTLHVAPLHIGEHVLGVLTLTFPGGSDVDDRTQADFVIALADALAQAIERSLAIQRAAEASERLAFLADASVALSASLDFDATVHAVTELFVPRLADWCVVQLLRREQLETVALLHFDPARVEWANALQGRYPTQMDAPNGAPNVIRTGQSELYPELDPGLIEASAQDPEHARILHELGMSSALVAPLTGRSGPMGAITLIYAESGRHYDERDVPFVEDVARRAALALETASQFQEQSGRLADVTRVAESAQRAILSPPPSRIGPINLAARYVSAAAEARIGGDIYEVVHRPGSVRLLIGDVRGKGLTAVRTATIVLGEFRAAAADFEALAPVARQVDRRLRRYLDEEDFVTALIAEITDTGDFSLVSCGHPAPLLTRDGELRQIEVDHSLPLGLGAFPAVTSGRLDSGDRLLLFTDGLIEARDRQGQFVDLLRTADPVLFGDLGGALDSILAGLRRSVGGALGDDLALLVAEYAPDESAEWAPGD